MRIGVPKEVKNHEYRVGLTTLSVKELISAGHEVVVETNAGVGIGLTDAHYKEVGAKILATAKEVFDTADMIVKVKEPQPSEYSLLRENQILFTYLHLAPDPDQAKGLIDSKCVAIAYETVTDERGGLPLLAPMSEVAGRMSVQVGAWMLEKSQGGKGVLLGSVPGVEPARVVVLGGGVVGANAARMAAALGAVSVVPEMTQPPEATEKVTAPLPLPPVVLKVVVCPTLSAVLVAAATSVACATGGGVLEPPQAATRAATEMEAAESSQRLEMNFMNVSKE